MTYLRKALVALALLVVLALALVWFLPARWALPWIEPQLHGLHLQQVHGSVWNGEAGDVLGADGRRLGRLHWQLSRRALFGQLQLQLAFDGPQMTFSGMLRRAPDGRIEADGWHLHADLAALDMPLAPAWGRPLGELDLDVEHALLQGSWPLQLQAQGQWHHAAVRTDDGELALGELQGQAQAQGGVVHAQWHDHGDGPLQVRGEAQLSPLGYRLDNTLRARHGDPALRRWLARLGPVAPDGSVHVRQSGGLAGTPTSTHQGDTPP
ncbi:type II secretion system protein N [Rhodanobacter lindaniclasticus]